MDEPTESLYGPQTSLAAENFRISGRCFPLPVVHQVARIKSAAAEVLASVVPDRLSAEVAAAIGSACAEVVDGRWDEQFIVDVFQTGSATSTHMNVNEVVATRATQLLVERFGDNASAVHPNDDVNLGQSSNDVMPSAVRIAAMLAVNELTMALGRLERELGLKADQLKHVVKAGRTHLQDAVPVTLGQEFGGYRQQVSDARSRLERVTPAVGRIPLGGTAVGNGLNAPRGYADRAVQLLGETTGLSLRPAPDRFAAQGAHDDLVELSGCLRTAAVALQKIANDIRLMASGPATGFGEITIPALQPGSSIMPGKVNPVVVEVMNQVVARVIGNDATIAFAGSQGVLELNTYLPVIAHDLLDSTNLLTNAVDLLADRCVVGIVADLEQCRAYATSTAALVTALNPLIGYDSAAQAYRDAMTDGEVAIDALVELVANRHGIERSVLEEELDILSMAQGTVEPSRPDLPFEDPHIPPSLVPPEDSGTI